MFISNKRILLLLITTFSLAVFYCIVQHRYGDYWSYTLLWDNILAGGDPWVGISEPKNAYGPLFTIFAIPYAVYFKLPRIIWVIFWFASSYLLIRQALASNRFSSTFVYIISLVLLLSPLLWLRNVHYAHFDIVVVALSLFSIEAKRRNNSILAGVLISLAFGLKYYPLAIVPFMSFAERKVDFKFIFAFLISTSIIFCLNYVMWGDSFVFSLEYMSRRSSRLLSVFRFLRGEYSPLDYMWGVKSVDKFSMPILLIMGAGWFVFFLKRNIDFITGSLIGLIITLTFFKVGNQQLHIILYFMLIYWIITRESIRKITAISIILYMSFLNVFDIGYYLTDGFHDDWSFIRDIAGLPSFIIMVFMIYAILRYEVLLRNNLKSIQ